MMRVSFAVRSALAATTGLGLAAVSASAAVIVSDGTFAETDWTFVSRPYGPGGGSGSAGQVLTGGAGDNGAARQTSNTAGPNGSGSYNASIFTAFSYNPSVGGAISDLSISIDARFINGLSAVGAVVEQDGLIWLTGNAINTSTWQTYTFTPGAGDWFLINAGGSASGPGPNFSATGTAMRFGFFTGNGTSPGGVTYTNHGLNDNFVVRFVPTPSAAALLGLSGLLAARRRMG